MLNKSQLLIACNKNWKQGDYLGGQEIALENKGENREG